MPRCYFCKREVTEDDFCSGCLEYVCSKCDNNEPESDHEVEDHKG